MVYNIFRGLGIALITPFTADGEVDYTALMRLVDYQLDGGADFFCILATTGETPTLTADEKRRIDDGRRRQGLEDPDHKRGFSDVPHGGHAELASYGKSDKAQGGRVDDTERLDILIGGKADPAYPQPPDPVGTDQHSREQKCRHIREVRSSCFKNTGQQKSCCQ
jgi:hypothetical protein